MPAGPPPREGRVPPVVTIALVLALAGAGYVAFACVPARISQRLARLVDAWEEARPDLEDRIAVRVLADFQRRLGPESPWRAELEADGTRLEDLRRAHLAPTFQRVAEGDGRVEYRCAVDFLGETADELPPPPLTEALPSVRVVELTVVLDVRRRFLTLSSRVEVRSSGARLDPDVSAMVAQRLERAGIEVRIANTR